jgi:hypothetical protein
VDGVTCDGQSVTGPGAAGSCGESRRFALGEAEFVEQTLLTLQLAGSG